MAKNKSLKITKTKGKDVLRPDSVMITCTCSGQALQTPGAVIQPSRAWRSVGQRHDLRRWQIFQFMVAPDLPPATCTLQTVPQSQHMACNRWPGRAVLRLLILHVGDHLQLN